MKRVTIDIDDDFATALSITAAGDDGITLRMANTLISPNNCNYVKITKGGKPIEDFRKEVDDAAD